MAYSTPKSSRSSGFLLLKIFALINFLLLVSFSRSSRDESVSGSSLFDNAESLLPLFMAGACMLSTGARAYASAPSAGTAALTTLASAALMSPQVSAMGLRLGHQAHVGELTNGEQASLDEAYQISTSFTKLQGMSPSQLLNRNGIDGKIVAKFQDEADRAKDIIIVRAANKGIVQSVSDAIEDGDARTIIGKPLSMKAKSTNIPFMAGNIAVHAALSKHDNSLLAMVHDQGFLVERLLSGGFSCRAVELSEEYLTKHGSPWAKLEHGDYQLTYTQNIGGKSTPVDYTFAAHRSGTTGPYQVYIVNAELPFFVMQDGTVGVDTDAIVEEVGGDAKKIAKYDDDLEAIKKWVTDRSKRPSDCQGMILPDHHGRIQVGYLTERDSGVYKTVIADYDMYALVPSFLRLITASERELGQYFSANFHADRGLIFNSEERINNHINDRLHTIMCRHGYEVNNVQYPQAHGNLLIFYPGIDPVKANYAGNVMDHAHYRRLLLETDVGLNFFFKINILLPSDNYANLRTFAKYLHRFEHGSSTEDLEEKYIKLELMHKYYLRLVSTFENQPVHGTHSIDFLGMDSVKIGDVFSQIVRPLIRASKFRNFLRRAKAAKMPFIPDDLEVSEFYSSDLSTLRAMKEELLNARLIDALLTKMDGHHPDDVKLVVAYVSNEVRLRTQTSAFKSAITYLDSLNNGDLKGREELGMREKIAEKYELDKLLLQKVFVFPETGTKVVSSDSHKGTLRRGTTVRKHSMDEDREVPDLVVGDGVPRSFLPRRGKLMQGSTIKKQGNGQQTLSPDFMLTSSQYLQLMARPHRVATVFDQALGERPSEHKDEALSVESTT